MAGLGLEFNSNYSQNSPCSKFQNELTHCYRYVVSKDASAQTIYICAGQNHPALMADTFYTGVPHWIAGRDTPSRIAEEQARPQLFGFSISGFQKNNVIQF